MHPDGNMPGKRFLRPIGWRGAKILPYVDDFLLFAATRALALALRQRVDRLLTSLGLLGHPTKCFWEPTKYGHHLGIDIDTSIGYLVAPATKLQNLAKQARKLQQRATRASIWLPVKELHIFRGLGAVPFSRYPGCEILPSRIALRTRR
jgi:hypothetical protein